MTPGPEGDPGIPNPHESVLPDVLHAVGYTPMVRLNRVGAEHPVEILAKLEYLNPGGSVKDRIAFRMLEEAERDGKIEPGNTLIEATSGNTGIGLALACAVRGYPLVIVMPQKMSAEKQRTMEALGATIVRTRTEAAHDDPDSNFSVARRLREEIPNSRILDQWANEANPDAHEFGTGAEILAQTGALTGGRGLTHFVASAGTGGTITGVGRAFRRAGVAVEIVGADPVGSVLGGGEAGPTYQVEGIGYDFIPDTLDRSFVSRWVKTDDRTAFTLARRLIREEGLLVGGSCGSAMQAALEVARDAAPGSRIVVILPDGIRNYMSKMLDDEWLREKGFADAIPPKRTPG